MEMNQSILIRKINLIIDKNKVTVHGFVLAIYCVLHLVMTVFHEPWYDEAEAWQIARCASLRDILLTIPHYEGHPPLWHLILAIPAKMGMPYELSLSMVSLLFSAGAVALFLKYAPFNESVKAFVPFTYFVFYQYSAVSRPYCMMMLAMVLVAVTWQARNIKPIPFVVSMAFLCLTSSYGIIIAGGISIVWLFEIIKVRGTGFFKDKRAITLFVLLILALLLITEVMPYSDTSATTGREVKNELGTLLARLLYTFFMMIPESSLTKVMRGDWSIRGTSSLDLAACGSAVLLGLLIWAIIIFYGKHKKTAMWFVVPYSLFAVFASIVYFYGHHTGIGMLIFMFWAWITVQSREIVPEGDVKRVADAIAKILLVLALIISSGWTVGSFILEIKYAYYPTRDIAAFFKNEGLTNYKVMTSWREDYNDNDEMKLLDTDSIGAAVALYPYFEHNFIYNAHDGRDDLMYDTHKNASDKENEANLKKWRKEGYPDVLFNSPNLSTAFPDSSNEPDYVLVYEKPYSIVWKGSVNLYASTVYVTKELQERLGLPEVEKHLEYYIHMR